MLTIRLLLRLQCRNALVLVSSNAIVVVGTVVNISEVINVRVTMVVIFSVDRYCSNIITPTTPFLRNFVVLMTGGRRYYVTLDVAGYWTLGNAAEGHFFLVRRGQSFMIATYTRWPLVHKIGGHL